MADAREVIELRKRFFAGMLDCRAAASAYPDDFPGQFGCLYRRVVGPVPEGATVTGDPWEREFAALSPADRTRVLDITRRQD